MPTEQNSSEIFLTTSSLMKAVLRTTDRASTNEHPILILGETGVGKDLLAERIFSNRRTSAHELVKLNCAAIPSELFESELFGSEAGSFSGAVRDKKGLIETAHEGVLFLDEVSEMATVSQAKMLRVLESGEFYRVGGRNALKSRFKLVSAMNRDPIQAISEGRLREDLLHRIAVMTIHIPPLRERPEDIEFLIGHFLEKYSESCRKKIHQDDFKKLKKHSWPGNVRELRNRIISAVYQSESEYLDFSNQSLGENQIFPISTLSESVQKFNLEGNEMDLIQRAMRRFSGNRAKVSEALGISQSTLYRRLRSSK
jgi:transcriptional regulator with PAS, ATPase and Fis domain